MKNSPLTVDVAKYQKGLDEKVEDFEKTVLSQPHRDGNLRSLGSWGLVGWQRQRWQNDSSLLRSLCIIISASDIEIIQVKTF